MAKFKWKAEKEKIFQSERKMDDMLFKINNKNGVPIRSSNEEDMRLTKNTFNKVRTTVASILDTRTPKLAAKSRKYMPNPESLLRK